MAEDIRLFGTAKEQLDTVNEAIYAVLKGGQSYRIGTRELARADLKQLYEMQKRLQSAVEQSADSRLFEETVVGVFDGR